MYCIHVRIPVPNPVPGMPIATVNIACTSIKDRFRGEWVFIPKLGLRGEVYNTSHRIGRPLDTYAGGSLDISDGGM